MNDQKERDAAWDKGIDTFGDKFKFHQITEVRQVFDAGWNASRKHRALQIAEAVAIVRRYLDDKCYCDTVRESLGETTERCEPCNVLGKALEQLREGTK